MYVETGRICWFRYNLEMEAEYVIAEMAQGLIYFWSDNYQKSSVFTHAYYCRCPEEECFISSLSIVQCVYNWQATFPICPDF